jgi:hypothetical protein
MADDSDILLNFCNQYWDEIRHVENQRATLTNLVILIASAVVGLMVQQGLSRGFLPLTILLVLLGIYGTAITLKMYERYSFLQIRLDHYYHRIDELHPNAQFLQIKKTAEDEHKLHFRRLFGLRVHWLWIALHVAISLSGVALTLFILFTPPK